jgi:predicted nucleic acid-binding protein
VVRKVVITYRGKRVAVLAPLHRIASKELTPAAFGRWRRRREMRDVKRWLDSRRATVPPVIVDTDILVRYFRGEEAARRFLARVPFPERAVSALTVMELLQGCRDQRETRDVARFVSENLAAVIHPDEDISRRAIRLLELHARHAGLRVVDALIAATALTVSAPLANANTRHYRAIPTLSLVRFQPGAVR